MRSLITGLFFCIAFSLQAQKEYNQLSLEFKLGASIPISPIDYISRSDYVTFKSVQIGSRYMVNQKVGILGAYSYQGFGNSGDGLNFHRLSLEGVISLTHLFSVPYYIKEYVNLQLHGGGGVSLAYPENDNSYDRLGNILLGGTLLVKLSSKVAIVGDLTYTHQISQLYAYSGDLLNTDGKSENGSNLFIGVGVTIYLGKEKHHADWY